MGCRKKTEREILRDKIRALSKKIIRMKHEGLDNREDQERLKSLLNEAPEVIRVRYCAMHGRAYVGGHIEKDVRNQEK